MKLVTLLTRLAALGFGTFLAAVAFNAAALAVFTLAAGTFLALIAAHDYSPRERIVARRLAPVLSFPPMPTRANETERLAA
jgi:hypothetical protein